MYNNRERRKAKKKSHLRMEWLQNLRVNSYLVIMPFSCIKVAKHETKRYGCENIHKRFFELSIRSCHMEEDVDKVASNI